MGQRIWRVFIMFNTLENGLVGTLLPTNMAAAVQMYRDFLNFEQL